MRQVITILLVTAVVLGGAWWIDHLNGALTLQVGTIVVQAPLSVAAVALLLFAAVLYGIYRVLHAIFGVRHVVRQVGVRGARRRGDQAVTQTLVALAAREGASAKAFAQQARSYLGDTPQVLLLAASAGAMAGDSKLATEAYEKLAASRDGAFLGLRGLLNQAVTRGDWSTATDLARRAEKAHPGAAWLREERTEYAARSGDWQEALLLNRDAAPHAALAAAAADVETDPVRALKLAKDAYKRDPALPAAALAFARRLREAGKEKAAQDALRKTWAKTPQPDLAAFALAPSADRTARLKVGQGLVADAPEGVESHMLLARLSLESGDIQAARGHAAAAARAGLTQRRLYMLEADIEDAAGNQDAHRAALQKGAQADPDPEWHCASCGTTHASWHPACPNCHAVGRIHWTATVPELMPAQ